MNGISQSSQIGVPCGTNSEKKWNPWRQKPTISTIENDRIASTPVAVKWLVGVKGCRPGISASGTRPSRFAKRMNENSEKMYGTYFLPAGPTLAASRLSIKPVRLSTAICQRPGTSWRLLPPATNTSSATTVIAIHSAELVKAML